MAAAAAAAPLACSFLTGVGARAGELAAAEETTAGVGAGGVAAAGPGVGVVFLVASGEPCKTARRRLGWTLKLTMREDCWKREASSEDEGEGVD